MRTVIQPDHVRLKSAAAAIWLSLIALFCFMRSLRWFFARRPGTPLRVLCMIAFDTLHLWKTGTLISPSKLKDLAALLDFGACVNDYFDGDNFSREEYRSVRSLLRKRVGRTPVREYLCRLRQLERHRPAPGGDAERHRQIRVYRESVVRLSLGMVAAVAFDGWTIDRGIEATFVEDDLNILFRLVMLCQIIDDLLDVSRDWERGLPSFMTAHSSPACSLELTNKAAEGYAKWVTPIIAEHFLPIYGFLLALYASAFLLMQVINLRCLCKLAGFQLRKFRKQFQQ